MAECECGCGETVTPDKRGRPRRFASRAHALSVVRPVQVKLAPWQERNREHSREIKRRWRERHRDTERAAYRSARKARRQADPEAARAERLAWRQRNPEAARALSAVHCARRRARKAAAEGTFTLAEWTALLHATGHVCLRCGGPEPTVDHVVPLSRDGRNDIGNLQPLCGSCNSWKKDRTIDYRREANAA